MRYWPAALTYGNWGGPGWSGGEFVSNPALVNREVPAVDSLDALFLPHDRSYQTAKDTAFEREARRYADAALLMGMLSLPLRSAKWETPPKRWYHAQAYRAAAVVCFALKLLLGF